MESPVSQPSCLSPSPMLATPCVLAFSLSLLESYIAPPNLHLCKHKWAQSLFLRAPHASHFFPVASRAVPPKYVSSSKWYGRQSQPEPCGAAGGAPGLLEQPAIPSARSQLRGSASLESVEVGGPRPWHIPPVSSHDMTQEDGRGHLTTGRGAIWGPTFCFKVSLDLSICRAALATEQPPSETGSRSMSCLPPPCPGPAGGGEG